ncbi:MAG: DUF4836 family protein [Ilyomonas sp.]
MKNVLRLSVVLLLFAAISSCSKKAPEQIKHIPKEASVVFGISPQRMQDKLEKSNINFDSLMRQIMSSSEGDSENITLDDIKNSGIDFSNDFYIFVNQKGSIMTPRSTETGVVGVLKSASSFEAFLKKHKQDLQVQKGKGYSYAATKDGAVVGWRDDLFIVANVSSAAEMNFNDNSSNPNPSATTQSTALLTGLFDLNESSSIADIDEFKKLTDQKSDMLFWSNSSSAFSNIPFVGLTKAADLFKDMYSAGTIDFQDGKVEMDTRMYVGKDLKDILDKHNKPKADMDMVVKYPYPVNGFSAFSFDPKLLVDILKYIGADPTINQFLQQQGLTLDDVTNAFSGDFAVIVSNFGMTEKANPAYPEMKMSSPDAKFLFNAKVGNTVSYNKVMNALVQKGFLAKQGDEYTLNQSNNGINFGEGFQMSADNKNILIASGKDLVDAYRKGNGNANIPNDVRDLSNSKAFVMYVDIAGMMNSWPRDTSAIANDAINNARNTFKDVIITAENFDGKSIHGLFNLRTMNNKENSLATLVKYISSTASSLKTERKSEDMMPMPPSADSSSGDTK